LEPVYNICTNTFRKEKRSVLLPDETTLPLLEMQENMPPLLVDGRMTIVEIPRWRRKMHIHWRSCDGKGTAVWRMEVRLPGWVWWERNVGSMGRGLWREVFVEGF